MAKTQTNPVSPPKDFDRETLADFASILQRNLEDLFSDAHSHNVLSDDPADNAGSTKDIKLVDNGTDKYLVVKYEDGWYKTANLTKV